MGYFYINSKGSVGVPGDGGGSGETINLSPLIDAITTRGGTVASAGDNPTIEELITAIGTIPTDNGEPVDLSGVALIITEMGGTVAPGGLTLETLASAIGSIPISGGGGEPGVPIGPTIVEKVKFAPFLTVTDNINITFEGV